MARLGYMKNSSSNAQICLLKVSLAVFTFIAFAIHLHLVDRPEVPFEQAGTVEHLSRTVRALFLLLCSVHSSHVGFQGEYIHVTLPALLSMVVE